MSSDELPSLGRARPKWILPVAIIAAVVAVGGIAAYLISKPHPTAATTTKAEPPKKAEPAAEEPVNAGAFVPPPSQDQERAKDVNLEPREVEPKAAHEQEKGPARLDSLDRLPTGNAVKKKSGAKSGGKTASGAGFKAVGD